jgi:hypothetical protein
LRPGRDADKVAEADSNGGLRLPEPRPSWTVQLGAFRNHEVAVARVNEVALGDDQALSSAASVIEEVPAGVDGKLYRVRFTGLAPEDADRICKTLKADGRPCMTLAPNI